MYSGHWQYLDTLAAACAAAGDFDQAVAMARRAIAAAGHDPNARAEADGLERRLAGYRAGSAFVEPAP